MSNIIVPAIEEIELAGSAEAFIEQVLEQSEVQGEV